MKVKDLMVSDDIKYCTPEARLSTVARVMKENNRGALPVVDESHKVVGIITDRDICLALGSKSGKTSADLTVKQVTGHGPVRTVSVDQPVSVALAEMRRNKIGRLPVTDKQGKLKGMLSINNILTHALEHPRELGSVAASNENAARTVKALFERNNMSPEKQQGLKMYEE